MSHFGYFSCKRLIFQTKKKAFVTHGFLKEKRVGFLLFFPLKCSPRKSRKVKRRKKKKKRERETEERERERRKRERERETEERRKRALVSKRSCGVFTLDLLRESEERDV